MKRIICKCPKCFEQFYLPISDEDHEALKRKKYCYYTLTKSGWLTGCRKRINYSPNAKWKVCPYCARPIYDELNNIYRK